MRFPKLNGKQSYRVSIPKLDGGLNGCDPAEQIEDNQLADCLNMWWRDGALRTRPGVTPLPGSADSLGQQFVYFESGTTDSMKDGKAMRKQLAVYKVQDGAITPTLLTTDYDGHTVKSVIRSNMNNFSFGSSMLLENCGQSYTGMETNGAIVFISPLGVQTGSNLILGESDGTSGEWVDLSDQVYVPLVMVDGKGGSDNAAAAGKSYEAFNLLTGAFRCQFTSDGSAHTFALPLQQLSYNKGETVVVKGRSLTGKELIWEIEPSSDELATSLNKQQVDQTDFKPIAVVLNKRQGTIQFVESENEQTNPYPYPSMGITNNIEVKAWKSDRASQRRICNMRSCTWFGGNRSGYNGGTRLFAGGNPEYPNVIHWSDLNNPLYFPENNYAYVGDAGTRITALAKQEDKLIIFKEKEIYYTQYVSGQSYTANDILNSRIVDVTAAAASFPITPIHPGIGCDCPQTIQLCSNRLVWATSDRKVYALTGSNQYSENNVRELSRNVEHWLTAYSYADMITACSADYQGHYVLMVGNDLYLFNYQNSGYVSYIEYVNYSGMQTRIPWTRWKLDSGMTMQAIQSNGEQMVLIGTLPGSKAYLINAVVGSGEDGRAAYADGAVTVSTQPIPCQFQTKSFAFSAPEHHKDIRALYIGMTMDDLAGVQAEYVTEKGSYPDLEQFTGADGEGVIRLTPNMRRVQRFGLRISSEGVITVGELVMKYDVYGGGIR